MKMKWGNAKTFLLRTLEDLPLILTVAVTTLVVMGALLAVLAVLIDAAGLI